MLSNLMLSLLFGDSVGSSNNIKADGHNVNNGMENPFDKFGDILGEYQGPIGDMGIMVAVISAVVLLVLMMFAGEQMRARIKKHLIVLIGCVICLLGVSYFVEFSAKQGTGEFDHSIVPTVTSYLRAIFPTL